MQGPGADPVSSRKAGRGGGSGGGASGSRGVLSSDGGESGGSAIRNPRLTAARLARSWACMIGMSRKSGGTCARARHLCVIGACGISRSRTPPRCGNASVNCLKGGRRDLICRQIPWLRGIQTQAAQIGRQCQEHRGEHESGQGRSEPAPALAPDSREKPSGRGSAPARRKPRPPRIATIPASSSICRLRVRRRAIEGHRQRHQRHPFRPDGAARHGFDDDDTTHQSPFPDRFCRRSATPFLADVTPFATGFRVGAAASPVRWIWAFAPGRCAQGCRANSMAKRQERAYQSRSAAPRAPGS